MGSTSEADLIYNQMVVDNLLENRIDEVFRALADRAWRDIVVRVLQQPASVTELARSYSMSFAAVRKHVAVLERAGLVSKERRGREQLVRGDPAIIHDAAALLERYEALWRDRTGRMENITATDTKQEVPKQRKDPS